MRAERPHLHARHAMSTLECNLKAYAGNNALSGPVAEATMAAWCPHGDDRVATMMRKHALQSDSRCRFIMLITVTM
jgi:hypothetical protein